MYDEVVKTINLTSDEVEILIDALSYRLAQCVSVGEDITVRELLEKIQAIGAKLYEAAAKEDASSEDGEAKSDEKDEPVEGEVVDESDKKSKK